MSDSEPRYGRLLTGAESERIGLARETNARTALRLGNAEIAEIAATAAPAGTVGLLALLGVRSIDPDTFCHDEAGRFRVLAEYFIDDELQVELAAIAERFEQFAARRRGG